MKNWAKEKLAATSPASFSSSPTIGDWRDCFGKGYCPFNLQFPPAKKGWYCIRHQDTLYNLVKQDARRIAYKSTGIISQKRKTKAYKNTLNS